MTEDKIIKIVIEIINSELKQYKRSINKDSEDIWWKIKNFNADLGLNSLNIVEIFMECEKNFGIKFDDDEIMETKTVGDLIYKIQEKLR